MPPFRSKDQSALAQSFKRMPQPFELKKARIMMVDDDAHTLDLVRSFLEEAGYHDFVECTDARQALQLIERERPDLLFLDILMPEVSGFDILTFIRNHERLQHIPVVVLTAASDPATKLKALELGATEFFSKPVDQHEMQLRVRNTLNAKAHQDRLTYFDPLTGLPNRHLLVDRLDRALEHVQRYDMTGALMHIELFGFREINDTLGPARADLLLQQIAHRLSEAIRGSELLFMAEAGDSRPTLARSGGAEYSLLIVGDLKPNDVQSIAKRILYLANEPFLVDQHELYVAVKIGIALFPQDGADADTLRQNASVAVRALRRQHSTALGAYQFYSEELNTGTRERLELQSELRRAIERQEFELFYQPQYSIQRDRIVGLEALLRWQHPERGYVSPGSFIPMAEELGLIFEIGQFTLSSACNQIRRWQMDGLDPGVVAVNVSAQQFNHPSFVASVRGALAFSGIDPQRLKLEITESMLAVNFAQAARMLSQLREIGVRISIDDFGTGYSSLSYLRKLPIDELKVDRSFLDEVETSADSAAIVRAILALARSLDLGVVAEGVETEGQLGFLRDHQCDSFQGFLYARPMPAVEATERLRAGR